MPTMSSIRGFRLISVCSNEFIEFPDVFVLEAHFGKANKVELSRMCYLGQYLFKKLKTFLFNQSGYTVFKKIQIR